MELPPREIDTTRHDFNQITQACPGHRMRFDPAIVPELVAWFLYHISRLEVMRDANSKTFEQTGLQAAATIATKVDQTINLLNDCIRWAGEHWRRPNWEGVVHQMRLALEAESKKEDETPPKKARTSKRPQPAK